MRRVISIPLLLLLCGCADLGYYWHSVRGHMALMDQRVQIDDLLTDDALDARLRERLLLVQEIRAFSVSRLELPANGSYHNYVELERPYVLQNLVAAPEFSTRLHSWCYPIIGCASYRGFYDSERLQNLVAELEAQGFETYRAGVPAYSTLGWFDDPILSSFVHWPEYRLAGLLFHELTHQQLYIEDDTTFNESLASAVQQTGTRLWLQSRGQLEQIDQFDRWLAYRGETVDLIATTRMRLSELYADTMSDADKRKRKREAFTAAQARHREIAARYRINAGFRNWFANGLNNAKIGSIAAYNDRLPAFVNMIHQHEHNYSRFFAYAERVANLERTSRDRCLDAWQQQNSLFEGVCPALE